MSFLYPSFISQKLLAKNNSCYPGWDLREEMSFTAWGGVEDFGDHMISMGGQKEGHLSPKEYKQDFKKLTATIWIRQSLVVE